MSSLQKFHRRTNNKPSDILYGMGNTTAGWYVATLSGGNKLFFAPASTNTNLQWGSSGSTRGTTSTTDGLANSNTLAGAGQAAHPAAYYCRTLTTGGYNTWYLPSVGELQAAVVNARAEPFFSTDGFGTYSPATVRMSSTEISSTHYAAVRFSDGYTYDSPTGTYNRKNDTTYSVRAVRKSTVFPLVFP